MSTIKHFGRTPLNYEKRTYVKKIKENSKNILNSTSTTHNQKKEALNKIFKSPEFKTFVADLKLRVAKLNREYILQKSNNNPNVSPKISALANTLNAYTNELIGFYERTYYNIPNNSEQKQFIRDLKMIIGTYGKLQEDLTNIIYTSNTVENVIQSKGPLITKSQKSDTIKKIETTFLEDLRKKIESKPTTSAPTPIASKPPQPQPQQPVVVQLEANLENNDNNCYRNSTIHLLLTLLRDADFNTNLESAFDIQQDDSCNTKNNLKEFLIKLVKNESFHPQSILKTYNPLLVYSLPYKNGANFSVGNKKFKIKRIIDNSNIDNFNQLCTFNPDLTSISSKDHYFNIFKKKLKENIKIVDTNNTNVQNQDNYIDLIINSIYKSYGNALLYLISEHGLFQSKIFSQKFLNNIKINNDTYCLTSITNTVLNQTNGIKYGNYNNLEEAITNALNRTPIDNQGNKYIILTTIDSAKFKTTNFNHIFTINSHYYEVTDILYGSTGHYISLSMRNNKWYKYDDFDRSDPKEVTQNAVSGTVDFNVPGFYPNIFLLKKIGPVSP